ncbi:hypothetical protein BH10BAC1_BH10BAC1_02480 [soil metagenome]
MIRLISYFLLVNLLCVFSYKTVDHCIKIASQQFSTFQDYDSEKENSESEKSDDKNEKEEVKDLSEFLSFNKATALILSNQTFLIQQYKNLYVTSDYSLAVFSPPEYTAI